MVTKIPMQGDIVLVDTSPREGHEQTGRRPYIVLSNEIIAKFSNVVVVAPITTSDRKYPLYIKIKASYGMKTAGKVMLDQLTTIDYAARSCTFLERANSLLTDELLKKVQLVFQKNRLHEE